MFEKNESNWKMKDKYLLENSYLQFKAFANGNNGKKWVDLSSGSIMNLRILGYQVYQEESGTPRKNIYKSR